LKCRFTYIRVNENTNLCIELFVEFSLAAYAKIVVLRLPVGMLIVSQTRVGSSHGVLGTLTVAGEIMKLVRMIRPPRIAAAGTLIDFPICLQPWQIIYM
jgi:hypothetical protein